MPDDTALSRALTTLLAELVQGEAGDACFVLNPRDPGLIRSLNRLSSAEASAPAAGGGPSIAAHVDHLRYGLELLNRWVAGEDDVFSNADYSRSWQLTSVSDAEWTDLRTRLTGEAEKWSAAIRHVDPADDLHVIGAIASVAHLAYHLGAIRQINRSVAGPPASQVPL